MEFKKYWKYIIVLFLISFIVVNWANFSWLFNYRVAFSLITNIFQKKDTNKEIINYEPGVEDNVGNDNVEVVLPEPNMGPDIEKDNTLIIPSINIVAPIIFFDKPTGDETLHSSLDFGVVHYPDSALPGKVGQTIILGHSAPANWPKIKYDWVFSEIESLTYNEKIIVNFAQEQYIYLVKEKIFLERGEEVPEGSFNNQDVLVLISCWPPGKNIRRIVVMADIAK